MGIQYFQKDYFVSKNINKLPNVEYVIIDTYMLFVSFMTNFYSFAQKYNFQQERTSENITNSFCNWLRMKFPFNNSETTFILVFDNQISRKMSKWHTVMSRNYVDFIKPDFKIINKIFGEIPNIQIHIADYDADQFIFNRAKKLRNENYKLEIYVDDEKLILGNVAIISGDSDFLCFSPNHEEFPVINYDEKQNTFVLRNYKCIFRENKLKSDKLKLIPSNLTLPLKKKYTNIFIKFIGSLSRNDYIFASFYDPKILGKILEKYKDEDEYNFNECLEECIIIMSIYLIEYIKANTKNRYLYTNAFKFLSFPDFSKNLCISKLDLRSNETNFNKDHFNNLFYQKILNFKTDEAQKMEKIFKEANNDRENLRIREYFNLKNEKDSLFYFNSSCGIFVMCLSLLMIFFDIEDLENRNFYIYLAKNIYLIYKDKIDDYKNDYFHFIAKFTQKFMNQTCFTQNILNLIEGLEFINEYIFLNQEGKFCLNDYQ